MYKLWKFCCKNVCSNLFFCFQIYLGYFTEVKEDTKMEMMKRWIIQGDEKEVVNEKAEEDVEV